MVDSSQKPKKSLFEGLLGMFRRIPLYQEADGNQVCKDCSKWKREGDAVFITTGECEFYGSRWDNSPACKYAVKKKFLRR